MLVKKLNEVYARIDDIDPGIKVELSKYFSVEIPGARFMPAFKKGRWDGRLRLYNMKSSQLYVGLMERLEEFAKDNNYFIKYDKSFDYGFDFSEREALTFIKSLDTPNTPRDYQIKAFIHAIRNERCLMTQPTASGKTLTAYMICEYYRQSRKEDSLCCSYNNSCCSGNRRFQ